MSIWIKSEPFVGQFLYQKWRDPSSFFRFLSRAEGWPGAQKRAKRAHVCLFSSLGIMECMWGVMGGFGQSMDVRMRPRIPPNLRHGPQKSYEHIELQRFKAPRPQFLEQKWRDPSSFSRFLSRADGWPGAGDSQPIFFRLGPNWVGFFDLLILDFTNSKFIADYEYFCTF